MAYRAQWVADILGSRSVADVAVDVHSTTVGNLDRPNSDQSDDIMALREVVRTWNNAGIM